MTMKKYIHPYIIPGLSESKIICQIPTQEEVTLLRQQEARSMRTYTQRPVQAISMEKKPWKPNAIQRMIAWGFKVWGNLDGALMSYKT